jgi:hypothetical protein
MRLYHSGCAQWNNKYVYDSMIVIEEEIVGYYSVTFFHLLRVTEGNHEEHRRQYNRFLPG